MGPADNLTLGLNSDSMSLSVPMLHDDGSNLADYEPRVERALGAKVLWRHIVGTAIALKPYAVVAGVLVLADGTTQASDDQVELKESKFADYDKKEYLAQHIILSTTSTQLGIKLKSLKTMKEMWDIVKTDAMSKSTLYILDAEDQLSSMKLKDNEDPATHLSELKQHFQLMLQQYENLMKMGSEISESHLNMMIMSSPGILQTYPPNNHSVQTSKRLDKSWLIHAM